MNRSWKLLFSHSLFLPSIQRWIAIGDTLNTAAFSLSTPAVVNVYDSVQAPLILTAMLAWAASANSFGRSANGCAGDLGLKRGTANTGTPEWSCLNVSAALADDHIPFFRGGEGR